ncbi:MAG: hypothetical protein FJX74_10200 [Armatimonadetes bacterium]|nr:hypothetical protein [Armatimonadota bacterium]
MQVPARFLRVNPSYRGTPSEEGWLEIDIKAVDIEGVSKLYVNLDEVARIRTKREAAGKVLDAWDAAFGKKDDDA